MSRTCEITGIKPLVGNMVSHSKRKTRTRFLPNLCNVTLRSEALGTKVRMRIAARTLKSIDLKGGLDSYLISRAPTKITVEAKQLRKKIMSRLAQQEPTPTIN